MLCDGSEVPKERTQDPSAAVVEEETKSLSNVANEGAKNAQAYQKNLFKKKRVNDTTVASESSPG